MYYPMLDEVKEILKKGDYSIIPITKELYSDTTTPIEVLKILKNISKHCYLLESMSASKRGGRYTFLGFNPKSEITCCDGITKIDGRVVGKKHPNYYIRKLLKQYRSPIISSLPTFTGGLVGYFAYDYFKYVEPTTSFNDNQNKDFNDLDLMLFDKVICFDNFKNKLILIVNIETNDLEVNYQKGIKELDNLSKLITLGTKVINNPLVLKSDFNALFSKDKYCLMVDKAKEHIKEGDIFQVVLSNCFKAQATGSLLDTYRTLRTINPSPYMFYLSSNNLEIVGASPETLVKLEGDNLYTFPLAGTRKRGKDYLEDQKLSKELLNDEKELAEHNMLVDLGRNDLGKVCLFNSVEVEKYLSVEYFSHVMHLGSTIKGKILKDKDCLDAFNAVHPAGTLSGAPKIEATKIINNLENNNRGIYGGAIGYIDFTGNLDTCIAIRLAYKKDDFIYVRSGAGIVNDSIAEMEYQECINKANAIIEALKIADGGLE